MSAEGEAAVTVPNALIQAIVAEAEAAEAALLSGVGHAHRCGELLLEAKALVPHGEWLLWLTSNFPRSARTARACMQLARDPNWQRVADLPLRQALSQIGSPKEQPRTAIEWCDHFFVVLMDRFTAIQERLPTLSSATDCLAAMAEIDTLDGANRALQGAVERARLLCLAKDPNAIEKANALVLPAVHAALATVATVPL